MMKRIICCNLLISRMLMASVLLFFSLTIYAQKSQIDSLIKIEQQADSSLAISLQNMKKQGVEKILEIGDLTADSLISYARTYLGTPHCMGGTTHKCIDCSGLLYVTFKHFGIDVPHNSDELAHYGKIIINADSLQKGDLVFFIKTYNSSKFITHSGIYLGDGKFIHTSASRGVIISDLKQNYYKQHFIFGTRIFL